MGKTIMGPGRRRMQIPFSEDSRGFIINSWTNKKGFTKRHKNERATEEPDLSSKQSDWREVSLKLPLRWLAKTETVCPSITVSPPRKRQR